MNSGVSVGMTVAAGVRVLVGNGVAVAVAAGVCVADGVADGTAVDVGTTAEGSLPQARTMGAAVNAARIAANRIQPINLMSPDPLPYLCSLAAVVHHQPVMFPMPC